MHSYCTGVPFLFRLINFFSFPCFWISEIKSSSFMGFVTFPPIKIFLSIWFPYSWNLLSAWFQMHISSLAEAVWRPGITSIFSTITNLMPGAESWDFCLPILSVKFCAVRKVTSSFGTIPLAGIAIFPGRHQICFINLCESIKLIQSPLWEVCRGLWARTHGLGIDSTILWSCDTCSPVSHMAVTSNEKYCKWPMSCPVWQTALLCRSVCGVLSKGMTSGRESGKCLLRVKNTQSCCRALV